MAATSVFSFGVGVAVGSALWGNCDWGRHDVNINVNRYNSFNRTNITNARWDHNVQHRKGVQYRDSVSQQKYNRMVRTGGNAREAFRGRAESGRQQLAGGTPQGHQREPERRHVGTAQRDRPATPRTADRQLAEKRQQGGQQRSQLGQERRQGGQERSQLGQARQHGGARQRQNIDRTRQAGAFQGLGNGREVRRHSARGAASRQSAAASRASFRVGGGRRFQTPLRQERHAIESCHLPVHVLPMATKLGGEKDVVMGLYIRTSTATPRCGAGGVVGEPRSVESRRFCCRREATALYISRSRDGSDSKADWYFDTRAGKEVVAMTLTPLHLAMAASAAEIDRDVDAALRTLYDDVPAAKELATRARGILVCPNVVKAGLIVGGQYGERALRKGDKTVGYYNIAAASFGLQAGGQTFSFALFFMNDQALQYLDQSGGWEIGVGPSIVVVDAGVAQTLTTTIARDDVYAFIFSQKGLVAGLGLQSSKITKFER